MLTGAIATREVGADVAAPKEARLDPHLLVARRVGVVVVDTEQEGVQRGPGRRAKAHRLDHGTLVPEDVLDCAACLPEPEGAPAFEPGPEAQAACDALTTCRCPPF